MFADPDASIVRSPVANDVADRVFVTTSTGGGVEGGIDGIQFNSWARFRSGLPFYRLGLPNGPSTFNVDPAGGTGNNITRVYAATWYSSFGEESLIGTTLSVAGKENGTWTVQSYPSSPPSSPGPNAIKAIRFYRATQAGGQFRFVRQVDLPPDPDYVSSFVDNVSEASLALRFGPPTDTFAPPEMLRGLVVHPNGFLAAFSGRDIYMSVPYLPYAWPPNNVVRVQHDIVALKVIGDAIAVLTTGSPVLLVGSSPETITAVQFDAYYPCVSARSAVVYNSMVVYASYDGLVAFGYNGADLISTSWVTPEQWAESWALSASQAAMWGSYYISLAGMTGFMVSLKDNSGLIRIGLPFDITSLSQLSDDGTVCLAVGEQLFRWSPPSAAALLPAVWSSKLYLTTKPVNFAAFTLKLQRIEQSDEPPEDDNEDLVAFNAAMYPTLPGSIGSVVVGGPAVSFTPPAGRRMPSVGSVGFAGLYQTSPLFGFGAGAQLSVRIDADGRTIFERAQADEEMRRLPEGYKAHRWSVTLAGVADVMTFAMAETGRELANAI